MKEIFSHQKIIDRMNLIMKKERLEYSFGLSFCRFTLFVFSVAVVASWLVFTGDEEEAFFMPLVARVVVGSTCVCEGASTHYAR